MKTQIASGAKTFTIIIPPYFKTYLPDILDLKDRTIKYIDCVNGMIEYDINGNALSNDIDGTYISLMQKGTQNLFIKGCNVNRFCPYLRYGERDEILKEIDMINSFVENNTNQTKIMTFVFWYDEPQIMNPFYIGEPNNVDYVEIKQFDQLNNRIYFGENRTLLDKQISSFTFPFVGDGEFQTPSNKKSVSTTVLSQSYLTLQKNNFMFIENVPLCLFTNDYMFNRIILQNVKFDFQNSYISIINGVTVDGVYFANVEYKN